MIHAAISDRCGCFSASTSAPQTRHAPRCLYPVTCGADAPQAQAGQTEAAEARKAVALSRRALLSVVFASAAMPMIVLPAEAVQGYTAGRLPGMSYA